MENKSNKYKFIFILVFIFLLGGLFIYFYTTKNTPKKKTVTNFEECQKAGYKITEGEPKTCTTPEGKVYTYGLTVTVDSNTESTTETSLKEAPVVGKDDTSAFVDVTKKGPDFDNVVTFKPYDRFVFADGLVMSLRSIYDSRCKPGAQCIWVSELTAIFSMNGGSLIAPVQVNLGLPYRQSAVLADYSFFLENATEDTITVRVVHKVSSPNALAGYVAGRVTVGPVCPAENPNNPCKIPADLYTSREAILYMSDQVTVKEKVKLDADGNYRFTANPGNYFVQIKPAGIGEGEKKPALVKSSDTVVVNFDIDTGIR
mgnify:FL=1